MALTPGSHLGVYEVRAPLGEGGMGHVFRARDTKLNRDVALKILPDPVANDADRLARFTREAQTLASLNHPNIAHVLGLQESDGVRALVMELVEGEDLSQRIARGAIPVEEALPIAWQIAAALEAAHERGIIHRDLKPANVRLRPDGTVKVLDFGLAKTVEPADHGGHAATITAAGLTAPGLILGTASYMAPEQATGKSADRRADIWAFGCVLFEMLTGRRAFPGETATDALVKVIEHDPDWKALPAKTPLAAHRLLHRSQGAARFGGGGAARDRRSIQERDACPARCRTTGLGLATACLGRGRSGGRRARHPRRRGRGSFARGAEAGGRQLDVRCRQRAVARDGRPFCRGAQWQNRRSGRELWRQQGPAPARSRSPRPGADRGHRRRKRCLLFS
jgi:hypothetical protein